MKYATYLCLQRDIDYNQSKSFLIDGDEILLSKDTNGKLKVASNHCPHRGMRLCNKNSEFVDKCKYHGWHVQYNTKYRPFTCGEAIFVVTDEYPGVLIPASNIFDDLDEEILEQNMHVKAPASLWLQNTCDIDHVKNVHPSFSKLFTNKLECVDRNIYLGGSNHSIALNNFVADKFKSAHISNTKHDYSFFQLMGIFFHSLIYPNLSITSTGGVLYTLETVTPINKNECWVKTRLFISKSAEYNDAYGAIKMTQEILQEDKDIVEMWAQGKVKPPSHTSNEFRMLDLVTALEGTIYE